LHHPSSYDDQLTWLCLRDTKMSGRRHKTTLSGPAAQAFLCPLLQSCGPLFPSEVDGGAERCLRLAFPAVAAGAPTVRLAADRALRCSSVRKCVDQCDPVLHRFHCTRHGDRLSFALPPIIRVDTKGNDCVTRNAAIVSVNKAMSRSGLPVCATAAIVLGSILDRQRRASSPDAAASGLPEQVGHTSAHGRGCLDG
jgi:hypothetical protein